MWRHFTDASSLRGPYLQSADNIVRSRKESGPPFLRVGAFGPAFGAREIFANQPFARRVRIREQFLVKMRWRPWRRAGRGGDLPVT